MQLNSARRDALVMPFFFRRAALKVLYEAMCSASRCRTSRVRTYSAAASGAGGSGTVLKCGRKCSCHAQGL